MEKIRKVFITICLAAAIAASSIPAFASTSGQKVFVETKEQHYACGNHKWGAWELKKEPSCSHQGLKTRKCSVCGTVDKKRISVTHTFKIKGNTLVCTNCGKVLLNTKALGTKLYQKKAYKLTPEQITLLTKIFVFNYGNNRDSLEAGISTFMNWFELTSKKLTSESLLLHAGSYYAYQKSPFMKHEIKNTTITNDDYLITKYIITKGLRVFPRKVTEMDVNFDLKFKTVKVNGTKYKIAYSTSVPGFSFVVYKQLGSDYFGYRLTEPIKNALKK